VFATVLQDILVIIALASKIAPHTITALAKEHVTVMELVHVMPDGLDLLIVLAKHH